MPTTYVFRLSSIRDEMSWMPALIMKLAVKINSAPMTGVGINANTVATFGKNADAISRLPVAKAMLRLVAPLDRETAMSVEDVDCPSVRPGVPR